MQIELNKPHIEILENIKVLSSLEEKEIIEQSLILFAWSILEVRKGYTIASYDATQKLVRQVETPGLKTVSLKNGRLK